MWTWPHHVLIDKVFIVDMKERTFRSIWKHLRHWEIIAHIQNQAMRGERWGEQQKKSKKTGKKKEQKYMRGTQKTRRTPRRNKTNSCSSLLSPFHCQGWLYFLLSSKPIDQNIWVLKDREMRGNEGTMRVQRVLI